MCFRALLYAVFHSIRIGFEGSKLKTADQKASDGRVSQSGFQFLRWLSSPSASSSVGEGHSGVSEHVQPLCSTGVLSKTSPNATEHDQDAIRRAVFPFLCSRDLCPRAHARWSAWNCSLSPPLSGCMRRHAARYASFSS